MPASNRAPPPTRVEPVVARPVEDERERRVVGHEVTDLPPSHQLTQRAAPVGGAAT